MQSGAIPGTGPGRQLWSEIMSDNLFESLGACHCEEPMGRRSNPVVPEQAHQDTLPSNWIAASEAKLPPRNDKGNAGVSFDEILKNRNNPEFFDRLKQKAQVFSDFAEDNSLNSWGKKIKIDEVVGKQVMFFGYKVTPSVKKEGTDCLTLLLEVAGEKRVMFSGSSVLIKLCNLYIDRFPFRGSVVKTNNYYRFD